MDDGDLIEQLPWDAEFWRRRVGRVRADPNADGLSSALDDFDLVYLLCDPADIAGINAAEQIGFRIVDIRCEVRLDVPSLVPHPATVEMRPANDDDMEDVRSLAATAHLNTRFGNDITLPPDRVAAFYRRWIERDAQQDGWSVLVATSAGSLAGYVTHGPTDSGMGSIGLVAVDPELRGGGLGRQLITAAVQAEQANGTAVMHVVTQGGSRGAMQMYQRCGFSVDRLGVWLHWHRA
jgi:GNAT superfamily N-acetyltransferase